MVLEAAQKDNQHVRDFRSHFHYRPTAQDRQLDLSRLPHHRHELDLPEAEKTCICCGRAKD